MDTYRTLKTVYDKTDIPPELEREWDIALAGLSLLELRYCEASGGHDWKRHEADTDEDGIWDVPYLRCERCSATTESR